ncbi:MAG: PQQ-binding-like beta-propeller repeat protein [Ferruginibacter sp.]
MPLRLIIIIITTLIFISGCFDGSPKHIQYKKGDFWIASFRNNSFPSKAYKDDRIYCSSLEIGKNKSNFFYCLNLRTGKVDWVNQVNNWASQPPIICDSFIYYCSYVGDIYKFDKDGNQIWFSKFNTTYGGHCINPLNNNLLVGTVVYGLRELDGETGEIVDSIGYGKLNVPFPVFQNDTNFQVIDDTLTCRNSSKNSILWQKKTGDNIDKLFLNDQRLYYFDETQCLNCLDCFTGKVLWQSDSIFPKQPFNPHLEFENGKILSYFSNLNEIVVLDISNGNVQKKISYQDVQKQGFLLPSKVKYKVSHADKNYKIQVMTTLFGTGDFRNQFDILIDERQNR